MTDQDKFQLDQLGLLLVPDHVEKFDQLSLQTSDFAKEQNTWYSLMPYLVALHRAGHREEPQDCLKPYREAEATSIHVGVFISLFDAAATMRDGRKKPPPSCLKMQNRCSRNRFTNQPTRDSSWPLYSCIGTSGRPSKK